MAVKSIFSPTGQVISEPQAGQSPSSGNVRSMFSGFTPTPQQPVATTPTPKPSVVAKISSAITNYFAPKKLPSGNTIKIVTVKQPTKPKPSDALTPDFGESKQPTPSGKLTPKAEYRLSDEYRKNAQTLNWKDKVIEVSKNPTKVVPFLSSGVEVVELAKTLQSAKNVRENKASKEDIQRVQDLIEEKKKNKDFSYQVADVLTNLVPFALELGLTYGIYTTGKQGALQALKYAMSKVGKEMTEKQAKSLGVRIATGIAGTTLQTPVAGSTAIAKKTLEKQINSQLMTEPSKNPENVLKSLGKSFMEQWVETTSERSGFLLDQVSKPIQNKLAKTALYKLIEKLNPLRTKPQIAKFFNEVGYNGTIGEMFEERVADIGQGVLEKLGMSDQPFKLPSKQQLLVELVSFSIPGLGGQILSSSIPAGEYEPDDLLKKVVESGADKTAEGKEIVKSILEAKKAGGNIIIEESVDEKLNTLLEHYKQFPTGTDIDAIKADYKNNAAALSAIAEAQQSVKEEAVKTKAYNQKEKEIGQRMNNAKTVTELRQAESDMKKLRASAVETPKAKGVSEPSSVKTDARAAISTAIVQGEEDRIPLDTLIPDRVNAFPQKPENAIEEKNVTVPLDQVNFGRYEIFKKRLMRLRQATVPIIDPINAVYDEATKKYTIVDDGNHRLARAILNGDKTITFTTVFKAPAKKSGKRAGKKEAAGSAEPSSVKPREKKPVEDRIKNIEAYIDKKGTKLRKSDDVLALAIPQRDDQLTTRFLEHIDVKNREFTSYSFLWNLTNSTGMNLKAKEKEIIQNVLNTQFKDEKRIMLADFRKAVVAELLPLSIIQSDTYADYGADNIGKGSLTSKTYILNTPFAHGNTGHFSGDFRKTIDKADVEIKKIPVSEKNPTEKFAVIRKGVELNEENIEENVFTVAGSKEAAKKWIDGHTLSPEETARMRSDSDASKEVIQLVPKGLFAHFRTFDDTSGDEENDTSHVAEIQSDVFQHGVDGLGVTFSITNAEQRVSRAEAEMSDVRNDLANYQKQLAMSVTESDKKYDTDHIQRIEEQMPSAQQKLDDFKKELEDAKKNITVIPKEEQRYKSYKNIWQEMVVREAIYLKANEGFKRIRFPTPHTVAVIEGYSGGQEGDTMPYEIVSADDEHDLKVGDEIDYGGETMTVVEASESSITVAPSDKVNHFSANDAITEDIDNRIEEARSQFETVEEQYGKITTAEEAQKVLDDVSVLDRLAKYNGREADIKREQDSFENSKDVQTDRQIASTALDRDVVKNAKEALKRREQQRDDAIILIKTRLKPTPQELKGIPKAVLEKNKDNRWGYSLDYEVEKILNEMSGKDPEETFSFDDFEDDLRESLSENYEPDFEGIYGRGHVFYEGNGYDQEVWTVEEVAQVEEFNQPDEYDKAVAPEDFDMNKFDGAQRTVLEFYDKQVIPYVKKIRRENVELITDDNGYQWWETKITEADVLPPTAYRIKDDLSKVGIKITDAQEKEIISLNARIFGDNNVKITAQILANNAALGSYRDGIIRILDKQVDPKDTFYHESVHKYLDVFMDRREHIDLLMEAQDVYGISDLSQVEERLAEDFIKYAKNREGVIGRIRIFLDRVFTRLKAYFANQSRIDALYADIISGKGRAEPESTLRVADIPPAENIEDYKKRIDQLNKVAQLSAIPRRTRIMKKAYGRFEPPSAKRGILPKEGTIALHGQVITSEQQYMETLAHELGHAIEFQITKDPRFNHTLDVFGETLDEKTKETILEELRAVTLDLVGASTVASKPQYYHRRTEMLARFFEKMFAAPGNLTELAPTAVKYFELSSLKHPQLREFLEATQEQIDKGKFNIRFLPDLRQTYQKLLGNRVGNIAYDEEVTYRAMQERGKIVMEKFIREKFKGIKDSPALLFKAAERIKVTQNGVPEFGTRDFVVAKNEMEIADLEAAGYEQVDVQTKQGEEGTVMAKQRYTPEEAKAFYDQLSESGKKLIRDFTAELQDAKDYFNREVIKDVAGIQSNLEGWVHHFFDDSIPSGVVGSRLRFKLKKAGTRQQRKGKEGFVEDFQKATLKALTELESEKVYNDFIYRQFARVTKAIPEGKLPDPGWIEVAGNIKKGVMLPGERKTVMIKDGKSFAIKSPRYQMPKEIYERYKMWRGLAEEASVATRVINDINRYWRINILSHIGTATTNMISGGIQFSSKILTDFYAETLTGDVTYPQTRADISSMLKVLLPKGWYDAPDWVYGADLSNWYGQFTKQPGIVNKSIDAYADKTLKLFSTYERYWKKVISLSEGARTLKGLEQMDVRGLRLPTQEERELIAEINRATDLYAYDYDNVPLWLEAHQKSAIGQAIKPFAKYPYKYAKHITNLVGAAFNPELPWQQRVAKLMALTSIMALYAWYADDRNKRRQTPAGTAETPARISPRGRLFVGTDDKGSEMFMRTAKYPFLNLTDIGNQALDGNYEDAVNILSDMIGTIAPVGEIGLLALGYKNKYEIYDEPGIVIANAVSSYVPMGRVFDDIARMLDPYQRKQSSVLQTFTKYIPTTDEALQEKLHGEIRTVRVPLEGSVSRQPGESTKRTTTDVVLRNYWQDILLSMLTGIYLRRIDPAEAEAVQIRAEENAAEAQKKAEKENK